MSKVLASGASWFVAAGLVLLLAACGGGGGVNAITPVDPAPAYAGSKTAATVTTANAEELAMKAFAGGRIGASIGIPKAAGQGAASVGARACFGVGQLAEVVNRSLRRMEIPLLARQRIETLRSAGTGKSAARVETFEVPGEEGGSASFTLDINHNDGTFSGTVVYAQYASDGLILSGRTDVMGALDPSSQWFTRLTLSFAELSVDLGSSNVVLIGSLSWGYNPAASSDTLTVNMVLVDSDGDTYWFNDYEQVNVYGSGSLTQTVTGRFYDAVHGYVDFITPTPMLIYYGNALPSLGEIRFSGSQGGRVSLEFQRRTYGVQADVDNNGSVDWQADHETINTADPNTIPVADAGADRVVYQWDTATLDGGGSHDPDDDPLTYHWSFVSVPISANPILVDAQTATPSFRPQRPGTYVLRLDVADGRSASSSDTVTVTVAVAEPSQPNLLQKQWQYSTPGTAVGKAGVLAADLDDDEVPEIITGAYGGGHAGSSFWYVLGRTPSGDLEQIWRSRNYPVGILALTLSELTGDGKDDVVVALSDGTIEVYSGAVLQLVRTIETGGQLTALALADLDGDGAKELVTSDGLGLDVRSAQTGLLKWSLASGGGGSIAVGNVDGDTALEIVSTTFGGKGYVVDSGSKAVTWEYLPGFGAKVALGELDGDGMQEIVGASSWYKITVFDADRATPVWEIATSQDIAGLLVTDTDADGVPEVVYGDGQWGKVHVVDVLTRLPKLEVANPGHGVTGLAAADADGNGRRGLLWIASGSISGALYLYVADPVTGALQSTDLHLTGSLSAVAVGDVDDDGADEVVMVSFDSDNGYSEGVLHVFDARTQVLEAREKLDIQDWMGVRSLEIGDVDGDGRSEFVVTTGHLYDGVIRVYGGSTRLLKTESARYSGSHFSALAIGDVDGDGRTEIVAGQGRAHSGAPGNYLLVLDGATLQEKWRSVDLVEEIYDLKLADLDGDGRREIVASSYSQLIVYDGVNHDLKLLAQHPSTAIEVADIDGDGTSELLVGRTDGMISVFDGGMLTLEKTVPGVGDVPVDALRLADLDADGSTEWLLASGGVLSVLDSAGRLKWRSDDLSGRLGLYNHIGVKDCDGDGRKEIYVGSMLSLYRFE